MEGITILAQETVRDFHYGCFIGMTFLVAIGFLAIVITVFDPDTVNGTIFIAFVSVVIGLCAGFMAGHFANDPVTQYKILVSEEASIVEFYEKYEIIGQEDLIFTVREKD